MNASAPQPEPQSNLDTEKIQELVIDERYREAFEALPNDVRKMARSVQQQVRETMGDVFRTEPDKYKLEIIDALSAGQLQQAATLLVAHPDNTPEVGSGETQPEAHIQPAPKKSGQPKEKPKEKTPQRAKPPYFPYTPEDRRIAHVEGEMIFPNSCERLADEVFRGENPRLKAWLERMERDFQVPSSEEQFDLFVRTKVLRLKRIADTKRQSFPPLPLNYAESNAYYYTEQCIKEETARAQHYIRNRSFAHLVEYIVVELLNLIKNRIDPKLKRVLKSAPEEDLFCGSDFVAEDEDGRWWSVDLTTSQDAEVLAGKRGHNQRQFVFLPSLKEMLIKRGEFDRHERLDAIPIVQQVDRNLVRMVTEQYLNSIKSGENKPLLEIFRGVSARLGKNDDQASRGILDLAS
ncbi:hypothetical protein HYW83_04880 [Candidatus Peregrinibacteria bacterium]|nr:hypothetical protein [Candidatus Peregrinibacteria bacterium]